MKVDFNSPIGKSLGRKLYPGPRVGLELEYEKCVPMTIPLSGQWHTDIDHSLRTGGVEFISTPISRKEIRPAIENMLTVAKGMKAKPTLRCGLHVHVNVTHMTWKEMFKFTTYYTLLEPRIFNTIAPGREMSHFCVPTWTNTALTEYMYHDGQLLRQGIYIPETTTVNWGKASKYLTGGVPGIGTYRSKLKMLNTPKYAALNMAALKKFGTLEFRQAPSSLNAEFIEQWANLLLDIQKESLTYPDTTDIIKAYDCHGIHALCENVGFKPVGKVNAMDQEDAADAATIMAGHVPVNWQQLKWEVA